MLNHPVSLSHQLNPEKDTTMGSDSAYDVEKAATEGYLPSTGTSQATCSHSSSPEPMSAGSQGAKGRDGITQPQAPRRAGLATSSHPWQVWEEVVAVTEEGWKKSVHL